MLINTFKEIIFLFNEVAIYLLFGFSVAGILHVIFPESIIKKHLGNDTFGSVIKSTMVGIPLPLCSCGVIPVAASLRKSGASRGASISFLISTPQIGADSFFITYSLMGWVFALFRIVASFITAMAAGITVNLTANKGNTAEDEIIACGNIAYETASKKLKNIFSYIQFEIFGSISDTLIIGIIVGGIISALVPNNFFQEYFNYPFLSMIIMMLIGIPLYVCASASTPIAAALIMKGISPGAALVFLLTGPATNAITISTVIKTMGKKTAFIYLISIALVSLCLGYILNLVTAKYDFVQMMMHGNHDVLHPYIKLTGSAVLSAMILLHYFKKFQLNKANIKRGNEMEKENIRLSVNGMTCMHCSSSVKKAVESIEGTTNINVDLKGKYVEFDIKDKSKIANVKAAVAASGFEVL